MMLLTQIEADLIEAQKVKDAVKTSILRFILANIHNAQIAKGKNKPLTDSEIETEITKGVRQHKESIEAFEKAKRLDLANKEKKELEILENYLPKPLTDSEISKIVTEAITKVGAVGHDDFGKVMAVVMPKVAGRAEGQVVAQIVKKLV